METTPLVWIDVEDHLPARDDIIVLVWAEITPEPGVTLRPLLDKPLGHACVTMARYASQELDVFRVPRRDTLPGRRWLLVPGDGPFKPGVVRRWAEFNRPLPEDRAS